jgi:hypothetical protein
MAFMGRLVSKKRKGSASFLKKRSKKLLSVWLGRVPARGERRSLWFFGFAALRVENT